MISRAVQGGCLHLTDSQDLNVRRVAVTALGHLARIHRTLDLDRVLPVLAQISGEVEPAGTVEDAMDDIRLFISAH